MSKQGNEQYIISCFISQFTIENVDNGADIYKSFELLGISYNKIIG